MHMRGLWMGRVLGLGVIVAPVAASAATLTVGPGKTYATVNAAVAAGILAAMFHAGRSAGTLRR